MKVIFGAGQIGARLCLNMQQEGIAQDVVFIDNNPELWDTTLTLNGANYNIFSPARLLSLKYEIVYVAARDARDTLINQLMVELKVPNRLIDCSYCDGFVNNIGQEYLRARNTFLKNYSELVYNGGISGSVAEVGVYRGTFAKIINEYFPDRTLYLYDTFGGFDERDIDVEIAISDDSQAVTDWQRSLGNFTNTSVDYVVSSLPNPEKCIIKKGFFPDTFNEEKESFCFVNLDCDLYSPIRAGLERFYPLLVRGGVILVHEYFDDISFLPGIRKAVGEFVTRTNCITLAIGDGQSIAIVKV